MHVDEQLRYVMQREFDAAALQIQEKYESFTEAERQEFRRWVEAIGERDSPYVDEQFGARLHVEIDAGWDGEPIFIRPELLLRLIEAWEANRPFASTVADFGDVLL